MLLHESRILQTKHFQSQQKKLRTERHENERQRKLYELAVFEGAEP